MLPILALLGSLTGLLAAPFYPPAILLPAGYLTILSAASVLICLVKMSACGLLAGLASGTMHMSWAAGFIMQSLARPR
jgi:succinoglycan biosynthesis protein ExoA